jgi:hypothetical protein
VSTQRDRVQGVGGELIPVDFPTGIGEEESHGGWFLDV